MRQRHQDRPGPAAASRRPGHRPGSRRPHPPTGPANSRGARTGRHAADRRLRRLAATAGIQAARAHPLSRPGARCWCCHLPVSPDRSPNPPYRSLGNGLSTLSAVRRGSQLAMGMGSCCPGRRNG
jgi:hypothetical protein